MFSLRSSTFLSQNQTTYLILSSVVYLTGGILDLVLPQRLFLTLESLCFKKHFTLNSVFSRFKRFPLKLVGKYRVLISLFLIYKNLLQEAQVANFYLNIILRKYTQPCPQLCWCIFHIVSFHRYLRNCFYKTYCSSSSSGLLIIPSVPIMHCSYSFNLIHHLYRNQ